MNQKTRFYRHYKNKPYKYLGTARHSETLEELALYETLYKNELGKIWVRPKDMFFEDVLVNGQNRPRFEKVEFLFLVSEELGEKTLQQIQNCYLSIFGESLSGEKFADKVKKYGRVLTICAFDGDNLVGFKIGYKTDSDTFYSWLGGVLPDFRSLGLATEMMRLQSHWCGNNGIKKITTKTRNRFPEMIRLNVAQGFKITKTENFENDIVIFMEKETGGSQ